MTRLLGGPGAGVTLLLKRAPDFLRIVQDTAGTWDALDQLEDTPKPDERIFVYRLQGEPTRAHINFGRKGCGWYTGGDYRFVEPQPADDVLRSTAAWRAWATEAQRQQHAAAAAAVGGQ